MSDFGHDEPSWEPIARWLESREVWETTTAIEHWLAELDPRSERIVRARFYEGLREREIAAQESISQQRVSQILAAALVKLREIALLYEGDAIQEAFWRFEWGVRRTIYQRPRGLRPRGSGQPKAPRPLRFLIFVDLPQDFFAGD